MNSVPHTDQTSMGLLLKVVIVIGVIVVLTIAISGQRLPKIVRVLPKYLVMVAVLLSALMGIYWIRGVSMQTASLLDATHSTEHRSTQRIELEVSDRQLIPVAGELESAKGDAQLPEWTRQPMRIDGGRKLIVVRSGRFASEEEAVLHGFQEAAVIAVKEYSWLDPRGKGAVQPQHTDIVKEAAIEERFMEKIAKYDFGKFKAPMHQLWLQVKLTPELGERLAEPWRQAAVDARLRTLTGWSVWGTAAAALAAFALRLDAAWNGRRRAIVAGTAIALTLGSLVFLA